MKSLRWLPFLLFFTVSVSAAEPENAQKTEAKDSGSEVEKKDTKSVEKAVAGESAFQKKFSIKPVADLQVSYTPYNQMPPDQVIHYPGGPDDERNFQLRAASLGIAGKLFVEALEYELSAGAEADPEGELLFGLENAYLRFTFAPDSMRESGFLPTHAVSVGAMKIPFSRQSLQTEATMQFIRRSIVVEEMPIRRDIGATISGDYDIKEDLAVFGFHAGVFNGQGHRIYQADNNEGAMGVFRVYANFFSEMNETGGDDRKTWLDKSATGKMLSLRGLQLSLAGSYLYNKDLDRTTNAWQIDAEFRWFGFSISGEYIHTNFETCHTNALTDPNLADEWDTSGWYVQGGYFVFPQYIEIAARYEEYNQDLIAEATPTRIQSAITVGLNAQYPSEYGTVKFMLNYIMRKEREGLPKLDNDSLTMQLSYSY